MKDIARHSGPRTATGQIQMLFVTLPPAVGQIQAGTVRAPEELQKLVASDIDRWGRVIREAKIKVE